MRFIELSLEAFQGIERAQVAFGPGLNILFGPNDLGKSTLACAIRAALLVPPKASEAQRFSSWFADLPPRVTLTFSDDKDRYFQVKKAYGSGAGSSAELLFAKDGKHFAVECKAREVEERIRRDLLGWGIPAPGGKGGPRLPESFLATVLLAAQTDVDTILAASLEKDLDDSGKIRLQKALATLAQDPTFKAVLDRAQHEYDVYFTPNGNLRRSQGSQIPAAGDAVKKHEAALVALRRELDESRTIEEQVRTLHEACSDALTAATDKEATLERARTGLQNARARAAAEERLSSVKQALAAIDAQAKRVDELAADSKVRETKVAERHASLTQAKAATMVAENALRGAKRAVREAESEASEQKRKLQEAELEAESSKLDAAGHELARKRENAERAQLAALASKTAASELERTRVAHRTCAEKHAAERAQLEQLEPRRGLARAVLAYGRYREAAERAIQFERAQREADEATARARTKLEEARVLEEHAKVAVRALEERRASLPTAERLQVLEALQRELEKAEAALGGGLSIAVKSHQGASIDATIDGGEPVRGGHLTGERTFEARRSARITIGDLVDIEVTAGAAERRKAVKELEARWEREASPTLATARLATLKEIAAALASVREAESAAQQVTHKVSRLKAEAASDLEKVELLGRQSSGVPDAAELATKKAAIGSFAQDLLEPRLTKLGKSWEAQAEAECERLERAQQLASEACGKLEQELNLAAYQVQQAEEKLRAQTAEAEALALAFETKDPAALLGNIVDELATIAARQNEIDKVRRALLQQAGDERTKAQTALKVATEGLERAQASEKLAQKALDDAQAELHTKIGEHSAQSELLASMDRAAATSRVEHEAQTLRALPAAPLASDDDVQGAEAELQSAKRALEQKRQELHKAEGALTKVGGAQLADRIHEEQEALEAARARERDLRTDADAWKLLRDALREAENADSAHLGRALARPVGERFRELTAGRYGDLSFDQHLAAAGLRAEGASEDPDVLRALSVGTRDQLATLVRLTIASQLKSAIILDDHLVHTDPARLGWFREMLRRTAVDTQVIVFTCRPEDYVERDELPSSGAARDVAGGTVKVVDLVQVVRRWERARKPRVEGAA